MTPADDTSQDCLEEWSAKLSHELGNAVWAISGYAELVKRGLQKGHSPKTSSDLTKIKEAAQRLDTIAGQLWLVNSLQASQTAAPAMADLRDCYQRTRHKLLQKHPGRRLTPSIPKLMLSVTPEGLEGLLTELLSNSLEFTDGSLRLEFAQTEARFALTLIDKGGKHPTPPDYSEWTAPGFSSSGRLGLGLCLIQTYLKAHGGTLKIEPLEQGTKWQLDLPISEQSAGGQTAQREGPKTGPVACVIDDQSVVRQLAARSLVQMGWQVVSQESGNSLKTLLSEHQPTLILLDLHLGNQSGYEIAAELRREGYEGHLLGFSASNLEEIQREGRSNCLYFDGFVEKNGQLSDLAEQIEAILADRNKLDTQHLADQLEQLEDVQDPERRLRGAQRALQILEKHSPSD